MNKLEMTCYRCNEDDNTTHNDSEVVAAIARKLRIGSGSLDISVQAKNGSDMRPVRTHELDSDKIVAYKIVYSRIDGVSVQITRYKRPFNREGMLYDPMPVAHHLVFLSEAGDELNELRIQVLESLDAVIYDHKTKHI